MLVHLMRSPGVRLVFIDGRALLQDRVDDSPRLFHIVLPCEQGAVASHRVAQHALVCFHLTWTGMTAGHHLHRFAFHHVARSHDSRAYRYRHLGTDPEPQIVPRKGTLPDDRWRLSKSTEDLRASHRQVLSCADVEGHPFPTPGIDLQPQCGKGFHLRIGPDSLFLAVAPELPSDELVRLQRWNRFQNLYFLITNGLAVCADRRLHRKVAQDLKQMVLDHVPNGA